MIVGRKIGWFFGHHFSVTNLLGLSSMSTKNVVDDGKLGLFALVAMCIGSMIGSGLFALPQNVASNTGVFGLLIAWGITFAGMICLAKVFQNLSMDRPDLDAGVYAYAKEGLGDYMGFNSAWGYWMSAWIGNLAYIIIFCASLSVFFPAFGDGTSFASLILGSCVIWLVTLLCILGVKSASAINTVATIAKIIPIVIFVAAMIYFFDGKIFTADIWQTSSLGCSVTKQIKNMMLITVWVFIGIEGASVFSSRARKRSDIGKATLIGFATVFLVLFAVSTLPFGILDRQELAILKEPSTSELMRIMTGNWGEILMSLGLMVSVLGAFLSWVLIAAEVPYIAGTRDGLFPKVFTTTNKAGSPVGALIITGVCQQLYLILAYFYKSGYLATILLATSMILLPYLFSAVYAVIVSFKKRKESCEIIGNDNKRPCNCGKLVTAGIATIYGIWLVYAAGIKYLLLSSILYMLGGIVYIVNKKQRGEKIFNTVVDEVLFWCFVVLGVGCMLKEIYGYFAVI